MLVVLLSMEGFLSFSVDLMTFSAAEVSGRQLHAHRAEWICLFYSCIIAVGAKS